jgi:hypothetical protein
MARTTFGVEYRMVDMFFDRPHVLREIEKREKRGLTRIGAFVRRTARSKMLRRRKRVSKPGQPPSVHSTDRVATLKNILFAYEPRNQSVVIGPVKLNQVNQRPSGVSIPIPALMELGGRARIQEQAPKGTDNWRRRDLRRNPRPWYKYRTRVVRYRPRPFMQPALAENQDIISETINRSLGRAA